MAGPECRKHKKEEKKVLLQLSVFHRLIRCILTQDKSERDTGLRLFQKGFYMPAMIFP